MRSRSRVSRIVFCRENDSLDEIIPSESRLTLSCFRHCIPAWRAANELNWTFPADRPLQVVLVGLPRFLWLRDAGATQNRLSCSQRIPQFLCANSRPSIGGLVREARNHLANRLELGRRLIRKLNGTLRIPTECRSNGGQRVPRARRAQLKRNWEAKVFHHRLALSIKPNTNKPHKVRVLGEYYSPSSIKSYRPMVISSCHFRVETACGAR